MPESGAFGLALRVVRGLASSGLATVPVEPTPEMIEAGSRAGGITLEQAAAAFKAMVREG
jgi:hypothetical protein